MESQDHSLPSPAASPSTNTMPSRFGGSPYSSSVGSLSDAPILDSKQLNGLQTPISSPVLYHAGQRTRHEEKLRNFLENDQIRRLSEPSLVQQVRMDAQYPDPIIEDDFSNSLTNVIDYSRAQVDPPTTFTNLLGASLEDVECASTTDGLGTAFRRFRMEDSAIDPSETQDSATLAASATLDHREPIELGYRDQMDGLGIAPTYTPSDSGFGGSPQFSLESSFSRVSATGKPGYELLFGQQQSRAGSLVNTMTSFSGVSSWIGITRERLLRPMINYGRLDRFRGALQEVTDQLGNDRLTCLRDVEKRLLHEAGQVQAGSADAYIFFCYTVLRGIQSVLPVIPKEHRVRECDVDYSAGYFKNEWQAVEDITQAHFGASAKDVADIVASLVNKRPETMGEPAGASGTPLSPGIKRQMPAGTSRESKKPKRTAVPGKSVRTSPDASSRTEMDSSTSTFMPLDHGMAHDSSPFYQHYDFPGQYTTEPGVQQGHYRASSTSSFTSGSVPLVHGHSPRTPSSSFSSESSMDTMSPGGSTSASKAPKTPRKKQGTEEVFTCGLCQRRFDRACDLRKHEKTHDRPYKCDHDNCKFKEIGFSAEKDKERHMNDRHNKDAKKFNCDYSPCNYSSPRPSNVKQHMEKAHGYVYQRSKRNPKRRDAQSALQRASPSESPIVKPKKEAKSRVSKAPSSSPHTIGRPSPDRFLPSSGRLSVRSPYGSYTPEDDWSQPSCSPTPPGLMFPTLDHNSKGPTSVPSNDTSPVDDDITFDGMEPEFAAAPEDISPVSQPRSPAISLYDYGHAFREHNGPSTMLQDEYRPPPVSYSEDELKDFWSDAPYQLRAKYGPEVPVRAVINNDGYPIVHEHFDPDLDSRIL